MKQLICFIKCLCVCEILLAQTGQWTWMSGDTTANNVDVYGNRLVFDQINKPGGMSPLHKWTDKFGYLYMYSGSTVVPYFGIDTLEASTGSLWKYSPALNQWSMPAGSNSTPGNSVTILGSSTWFDNAGNFYFFGGKSNYRDFGNRCSLFKFDIELNQWFGLKTCPDDSYPTYGAKGIASAAASPGARSFADSWTDKQGRLYLFGGYNTINRFDYGDVWMYDPTSTFWTWLAGKAWGDGKPDLPVYGISGEFSSAYTPGAPYTSQVSDSVDANGVINFLIDSEVWKYSVISNQWAWVSGNRKVPTPTPVVRPRHYGQKGIPSVENDPGPRNGAFTWTNNQFTWLYGGSVTTPSSQTYYLSDFWKYNRQTNEWTWVDGDSSLNKAAVFGTKSVTTPMTQPGGRAGVATWIDSQGNFWLFGGTRQKIPATGSIRVSHLNDLWKFTFAAEAILPLLMTEFSAKEKDGKVILLWTTSQEQGTKAMIIQRSEDGVQFKNIGTVFAAGNSSNVIKYNFTDNSPLSGINYYRLQEVSLDNSFQYSTVVNVSVPVSTFAFKLLSNPVSDVIKIELQCEEIAGVTIEVKDLTGRTEIFTRVQGTSGRSIFSLPAQTLPRGLHLITVKKGNMVISKRVLKLK